jgi:hypothetical protein
MSLKKWCSEVHIKARKPKGDFTREYIKLVPELREVVAAFHGIKTDFQCNLSPESTANLKASLIFSDFTSVYPIGGDSVTWTLHEGNSPHAPKSVRVRRDFAEQLLGLNNRPLIRPGYVCRNDAPLKDFLRQVEPLAKAGRLMVRAMPMVMGLQKTPEGMWVKREGQIQPVGRMWGVIPVDPSSPAEHWLDIEVKEKQGAIPLKDGKPDTKLEAKMCSFTLPYIEGLSFAQLARILDAEGDCLAEFRSSLRNVISEVYEDSSKATDITNDIVRPAVDKIERRFKAISNIHRMRLTGAYMSTAVLSLLALTNTGISAALASFLGASGLGVIAKEHSDKLKEKAELKEMPFYLLWRLQHGNKE